MIDEKRFTRDDIERTYKYMDECAERGCEWDSPIGVAECATYKEFAVPLFANEEMERGGKEK